ncbi:DNA cytosine methyltransferase (plasmid) [Rossellomorea sp. AcN35-11]|nr:DNA cytosine methyltransferase [Rossellomorea sp. AcN35-11]
MNIVFQKFGRPTYQGSRIYIDTEGIVPFGWLKGKRYDTEADIENNEIILSLNETGMNKISGKKRGDNYIPVIDKTGPDKNGNPVKDALKDCEHITISVVAVEDKEGEVVDYRVIIKGEKSTSTVKGAQSSDSSPTSITFCAGTGISSEALKQSGFKEIAAVEWNPKEGNEEKFSRLYQSNNPGTVMFNMPMEKLKAEHLPKADLWLATLDCTDYSKASNGTKKEFHTIHLFMHLMRLFLGET